MVSLIGFIILLVTTPDDVMMDCVMMDCVISIVSKVTTNDKDQSISHVK